MRLLTLIKSIQVCLSHILFPSCVIKISFRLSPSEKGSLVLILVSGSKFCVKVRLSCIPWQRADIYFLTHPSLKFDSLNNSDHSLNLHFKAAEETASLTSTVHQGSYFHYWFICWLVSRIIVRKLWKKCPSQIPRAQGGNFKLLVLSNQRKDIELN